MSTIPAGNSHEAKRWQPLESVPRRVLGVLIEKAKTTPENYPLSINALRSGCNQKSNRSPLMQLELEQIEEALENLRQLGAVSQVQGAGRVDRFRHLAYEWLGVEKVELAVMAELLLRGTHTIGELRGRAARMEPIRDLAELRPILEALQAKGLIVYLTPEGRGCIVTHTLYPQRELEKLRREHAAEGSHGDAPSAPPNPQPITPTTSAAISQRSTRDAPPTDLTAEVHRLREEVAAVKREFQSVRAEFESASQQLRRDLDELNRQLGV